jgi:hypothetical protein
MGSEISMPMISFHTKDFSSIRLPSQDMTYPQRYFRHTNITKMLQRVQISLSLFIAEYKGWTEDSHEKIQSG